MNNEIIYNAIRTPDGTVLESFNRHDFKSHQGYSVDGGLDYLRRLYPAGSNPHDLRDISQYLSKDHKHNRQWLHWGTYGKNGDQPRQYVKIKDMSTAHLKAVLRDVPGALPRIVRVMEAELDYRAAAK